MGRRGFSGLCLGRIEEFQHPLDGCAQLLVDRAGRIEHRQRPPVESYGARLVALGELLGSLLGQPGGETVGADGVGPAGGFLGLIVFLLVGVKGGHFIQRDGHHGMLAAHRLDPQRDQPLVQRLGFVVLLLAEKGVRQAVDGGQQVGVLLAVQGLANDQGAAERFFGLVVTAHGSRNLAEAIEIARCLLAGETIDFHGEHFQVAGRSLATGKRPIPIMLAASGPLMLELAGKAADGVVISAASSPQFVAWSLEQVRRGEAASGRRVRKIGLVQAAVDTDGQRAQHRLRRNLGFILRGAHHARNLALAGTQLDQAALAAAFAREDWTEVDELVTDDVVNRHAASGTIDQVSEALARYRAVGLDEIVLAGVDDPEMLHCLFSANSHQ